MKKTANWKVSSFVTDFNDKREVEVALTTNIECHAFLLQKHLQGSKLRICLGQVRYVLWKFLTVILFCVSDGLDMYL